MSIPDEKPATRRPAVRIVHHGGPAKNAMVFIDGKDVSDHVACIDFTMDADEPGTVRPVIVFSDAELDVSGELVSTPRPPLSGPVYVKVTATPTTDTNGDDADQPPAEPEGRPWSVFFALIAEVVPAGVAWWMWQLRGPGPSTVFAFSVLFGLLWALGVVGTFLTLSGIGSDDE